MRKPYLHVLLYSLFVFVLSLPQSVLAEDAGNASSAELTARSGSHPLANHLAEDVIAHPESSHHSLTLNQLRAIFSLRARKWPDGTHITVVVLRDQAPTHKSFLLNTLKMLPHQLRRQWDRFIYSGIGQGPIVVDSMREMVQKVNLIPGAIGYVEGGVPHEQVLTLSIR